MSGVGAFDVIEFGVWVAGDALQVRPGNGINRLVATRPLSALYQSCYDPNTNRATFRSFVLVSGLERTRKHINGVLQFFFLRSLVCSWIAPRRV